MIVVNMPINIMILNKVVPIKIQDANKNSSFQIFSVLHHNAISKINVNILYNIVKIVNRADIYSKIIYPLIHINRNKSIKKIKIMIKINNNKLMVNNKYKTNKIVY